MPKFTPIRTLANPVEQAFSALARKNGWEVTKRGWPDFLAYDPRSDSFIAVECKPQRRDGKGTKRLAPDQTACMDFLTSAGIRCFVSDGQQLQPYSRDQHGCRFRRGKSKQHVQ